MRNLVIIALAIAAGGACDRRDTTAAAGGLPAVGVPVGPIPGPGEVSTASASPFGDDPVAVVEGRRLFVQYNCDGCHGGHGGGGMGPSLRDPVWLYGDSDVHIFSSIAEGRAHGMPTWGVRLPEQQIWKLVSYIKSMRTEKEPEPPQ